MLKDNKLEGFRSLLQAAIDNSTGDDNADSNDIDLTDIDDMDDMETFIVSTTDESKTVAKEKAVANVIHFEIGDDVDVDDTTNSSIDEETFNDTLLLLKQLLSMAFPIIVSFFLGLCGSFITLGFAGHLTDATNSSSIIIAGISLGNMYANVTWMSLIIGMTGALETLGSQYNGSKEYDKVGFALQRSVYILSYFLLPAAISWLFAEEIFHALGIERSVCVVMGRYLKIRLIGLPIDIIDKSYGKYLYSVGVVSPSFYSNITYIVTLAVSNTIFILHLKWGYISLGISYVLAQHLSAAAQIFISLSFMEVKRSLQPINVKEATSEIYQYLKLGLPGTLMLCSEWWAFEILTVFSSRLGTESIGANTLITQIASLAFMIPLGIGVSTSSLIGNAIGADNVAAAKKIAFLSFLTIVAFEIVMGVILYFTADDFIALMTDNDDVKSIAHKAILFLCFFVFFDGVQGALSGVLRGAGRQELGAIFNIIAFYCIGLESAYILCFYTKQLGIGELGVRGLIMGISLGTLFQDTVLIYLVFIKSDFLFSAHILSKSKNGNDKVMYDKVNDIDEVL